MLKILLSAAVMLSLLSMPACSKSQNEKGKSAGTVIGEYKNTLVGAPQRAKDAARSVEDKAASEEKAIKELDGTH